MLLAQYKKVVSPDIDKPKEALLKDKQSSIENIEISDFLQNKQLNFTAATNKESALLSAEYGVIATSTDRDKLF